MTVTVGDVIRVTARMSQGTDDVQNVYHYKAGGSGSAADVTVQNQIAAALDAAYTDIDDELTTGLSFDDIDFHNITQDEPMGAIDWPVLTAGVTVAETLPLQASACCIFDTAVTKSQGRKFLPPMREAASDDKGVVGTTATTAILAYIVEILATITAGSLTFDAGNYNTLLARFAVWISGELIEHFKTQRRRVVGVGS